MQAHRNLWWYVKGGSKSKYSMVGKIYSHTLMGASEGGTTLLRVLYHGWTAYA